MARSAADTADAAALAACSRGSAAALERLYTSHAGACLSLARAILNDGPLAEDAVQEAFLQLWRDAGRFEARRSSVRVWLLLLTRRKALDRIPAEEPHRPSVVGSGADRADDHPEPDGHVALTLLSDHAREALATLPAAKREAVVLAFWGGYSQPEIAALTHTPLGTVKSRMHDGLRALAGVLAEQGRVAGSR